MNQEFSVRNFRTSAARFPLRSMPPRAIASAWSRDYFCSIPQNLIPSLWRFRAVFAGVVLTAAIAACRSERAPVEELYTTRMLGLSYLQRNQLPEAESAFKK